MKTSRYIFILLTLSLCSCYWKDDSGIASPGNNSDFRQDEFYWYYNHELFNGVDSCYIVGTLETDYEVTYSFSINQQCKIYNDTIYVIKRNIAENKNIFNGVIYIKNKEPYILITKLK